MFLKRFCRWVLRDERQRQIQAHVNALVFLQAELENFTRAVRPFMELRGKCVTLALGKLDKPSSFYMVSRFDYQCLRFSWGLDVSDGFQPLRFAGMPIIWAGDSCFRELDNKEQFFHSTFDFPGSGDKPKDKTLKKSVLPSTGASKSSGCSRGRSRGAEEDIPEAFFPWREF